MKQENKQFQKVHRHAYKQLLQTVRIICSIVKLE